MNFLGNTFFLKICFVIILSLDLSFESRQGEIELQRMVHFLKATKIACKVSIRNREHNHERK